MRLIGIFFAIFIGGVATAHAGIFDEISEGASKVLASVKDKTEEKEMTNIKLPLNAIKRKDPKIDKIEEKVVLVAMKRNARIELSCPDNKYCKRIESGIREKARKAARGKANNDYAAKALLPKIEVVRGDGYVINLYKKGIRYGKMFD